MCAASILTINPLRYEASMEHAEDREAETDAELDATMRGIQQTTFEHLGHPIRSVHAKSHGVLMGTLTVAAGLPSDLAQGLFAEPSSYATVMRFSTLPGDLLDDSVSTPRGLAIKVVDVKGPRLPGSEGDVTQDFVLVNGPAFAAPNAKKFLGNLKLLAATTDKVEGLKDALSRLARGTEAVQEAFGVKSPMIRTLGGQPATHILGDTFYSQTPFLFGPFMCKFSLVPVSPGLTALTDKPIEVDGKPDALRESVIEYFGSNAGEWELRVQLRTGLESMPIEDASVAWPEKESPYVTVGRLSVPAQNAWSAEGKKAIDEGLAFSPWHGLAAHRPLGSVNRARQATYERSAAFRGQHSGCPMHEPRTGTLELG